MKKKKEDNEDTTKYGEFISTFFQWITPEEQRKRAEELNNKTKK